MSLIAPPHKFSAARWKGLRVGLLGGSFNPAHAGHMHIAKQAMIRFKLHAIWWVVSPGNPLKVKDVIGDLDARAADVTKFIGRTPKMVATDIEGHLKTRYTFDTLKALRKHFPTTKFIWVAGMDNAVAFNHWDRWEKLPNIVPFVFFDRPPALSKLRGKAVRQNKAIRQHMHVVRRAINKKDKGVYWMVNGRAVNLSSSEIRAKKR